MWVSVGALLLLAFAHQVREGTPRIDGVADWDIVLALDPTSRRTALALTSSGCIVQVKKDGSPILITAAGHNCRGKPLILRVDQGEGILLGETGRRNVRSAFNKMLTGVKAVIAYYRHPCGLPQRTEVSLEGFAETIAMLRTLATERLDTLAPSIIEEREEPSRAIEETIKPKETLLNAARDGDLAKVMALLILGVDVNTRADDNGYTPLIWAAARGHAELVNTLLAWGANVNAEATDGQTALMKACDNGHLEAVAPLLGSGADVNLRTEEGITALDLALRKGHQEIVELLRYVGAKE